METVYIVGIIAVAAVLIGIVWLLRDRITTGRFGASAAERKVEAEFKATSPRKELSRSAQSLTERPSDIDISDNWMVGSNMIRVFRNSVRVARNRLLGKQRIEIQQKLSEPASKSRKRNRKE
jgi:hypothetical protein